jgi:FixJ family two-component response regulator
MSLYRALAAGMSESDLRSMRVLLDDGEWKVQATAFWKHVGIVCRILAADVVLCDRKLPDGEWTDVLARLKSLEHPPPLVVCDPAADDRLWCEVLHMGAYDLMAKPFRAQELTRVLGSAAMWFREQAAGRSQTQRPGLGFVMRHLQ